MKKLNVHRENDSAFALTRGFVAAILSLLLIFTLTGCKNREAEEPVTETEASETETEYFDDEKDEDSEEDTDILVWNSFKLVSYGGGIKISEYLDKKVESITIPSQISGLDVMSIGAWAFESCEALQTVDFEGDNLIEIDGYAFSCCISLSEIDIPDSVTEIGDGAFEGCCSLTDIAIPDSIERIGDSCFEDCSALENITIPDEDILIGQNVLNGTMFAENSDNYSDGVLYIGNHLIDSLDVLKENVKVRDGTRTIASHALASRKIKTVSLPDSLTVIGDYAFEDNDISEIVIPSSIKQVGTAPLRRCSKLKSITMRETRSKTDNKNKYTAVNNCLLREYYDNDIGDSAEIIQGCKTSVIPGNYHQIDINDLAFGNMGVASIDVPDSIWGVISEDAFEGAVNVNYFGNDEEAPWGAKHLNDERFSYSEGNFIYKDKGKTTLLNCKKTASGDVTVPKSVKKIISGAFHYCEKINSLTVPDSVKEIDYDAFEGVLNVNYNGSIEETWTWGQENTNCYAESPLVYENKDKKVLVDCDDDVEGTVEIPSAVTEIDYDAFEYCLDIKKIILPNKGLNIYDDFRYTEFYKDDKNWSGGLLYIGKHLVAAKKYEIPEKIVIKNGTLSIARAVFSEFENIKSVTFPDSLEIIGNSAFYGVSISQITIPQSIKEIKPCAFEYCKSLTKISLPDKSVKLGWGVFYNTGYSNDESNWEDGALYVEKHLVETDSEVIKGDYTVKSGTLTVASSVFEYCNNLKTLRLPDGVTYIGAYAFGECGNLEKIYLPKSLKTVEENAFGYSEYGSLKKLELIYYGTKSDWEKIDFEGDTEYLKDIKITYRPKLF